MNVQILVVEDDPPKERNDKLDEWFGDEKNGS
jgi:hypothetical protein